MRYACYRLVLSAGTAVLLATSAATLLFIPASSAEPWMGEGWVVINEFTPSSRTATDEFIELRNIGDDEVSLDGWRLLACAPPNPSPVLLVEFGPDDAISAGGVLLGAHRDSSLVFSDFTYGGSGVPDDGGWLIADSGTWYTDGVGLNKGTACTEGEAVAGCSWSNAEAASRDEEATDTDDNSADFTCRSRTPGF